MARAAYVVAKLLYASAYAFGGIWHQRLAFGELDSPLERNARVHFDSFHTPYGVDGLTNSCFGDSELWWSWCLYTLKGCLASCGGFVALASTVSFFSISARTVVTPLVALMISCGLGTMVLARTSYNGPLLNAIGGMIIPGISTIGYSFFLARRLVKCNTCRMCCERRTAIWDVEAEAEAARIRQLEREQAELSGQAGARRERLRTCTAMALGGCLLTATGFFVCAEDWDWLSWNCAAPCPDDCPMPLHWTHNAIVNYTLVVAWALYDIAMFRLLPVLEKQLEEWNDLCATPLI